MLATPVLATLEWRPEYQNDLRAFIRMLGQEEDLLALLRRLVEGGPTPSGPVIFP